MTISAKSSASTCVIASRAEALERARALTPQLRARAAAADRDRAVPAENIRAINEAGLFRVMAPKAYGGSQLGLACLIEVAAEIASGCGSTGWLFGVLGGHAWLMGLYPAETQKEFFDNPRSLAASVVRLLGDRPKRVAGGYAIRHAHGKFCSGVDHSDWIILGAGVEGANGGVDPTYLVVPKSEVEVVDDWHTSGMRGTGSRSLRIREAFVPDRRGVAIGDMVRGTAPGIAHLDSPAFRLVFPQVLPITLAGAPLGLGRAGVAAFIDKYRGRLAAMSEEQMGEQSHFFMRLTEATAEVDAAYLSVVRLCEEIDAMADGTQATPLQRARFLRDISHAAWRCRTAVNSLYEGSGGSVIYDEEPLQRIWRDMNAAAAHNSFVRERSATMFGRALLGLQPSKFDRIGH